MSIINQFKTVVLLGFLTGLLLWIGSFWGQSGLLFALIFSIIMNFGSYWFSDKIVLRIYRAKEVNEEESPQYYRIVKEIAQKANIPMPKVCIVPGQNLNAFATGRSPKKGVVACTEGILQALDEEELKGVIAHEMSHIKNRDTLISSIAATIAGVISYIAFIARWGAMFGGFRGNDEGGSNMVELLVLAILTPLLATIIQLAISRSREYLADASAAKILNNGEGLAKALEKLERGVKQIPLKQSSATKTTAHMFIINPFSGRGLIKLFSTHPLPQERIKRLREMKF